MCSVSSVRKYPPRVVGRGAELKIKTMRDTLQIASGGLVAILTIDAFGFMVWILSGQTPADSFYIGTLTAHALRALFGL